ncbi:hypothetical protein ATANTOWER_008511 [Ataeniobius toweri]|uniref:Uncharacterized protein n=1 Tax=Ataeniobius toweri TaxID=208326 RepID=A0ABU7C0S4_9TELE|nr:hypothetical protein [Ataeniobius toweri]
MLIVSLRCDRMVRHEVVEAIYPLTFDLYLRSHFMWVGVCVQRADCMGDPQLSTLCLSATPFLKYKNTKHTRQMLACRYKDMQMDKAKRTFQRTDILLCRTLKLSL